MEKYVQIENVHMVFNTKKGPFVALPTSTSTSTRASSSP